MIFVSLLRSRLLRSLQTLQKRETKKKGVWKNCSTFSPHFLAPKTCPWLRLWHKWNITCIDVFGLQSRTFGPRWLRSVTTLVSGGYQFISVQVGNLLSDTCTCTWPKARSKFVLIFQNPKHWMINMYAVKPLWPQMIGITSTTLQRQCFFSAGSVLFIIKYSSFENVGCISVNWP